MGRRGKEEPAVGQREDEEKKDMEKASLLLPESMPPDLTVRLGLHPGDMGAIIRLHGILYAQECGFDETFEAYVAAGLAEFVQAFDPQRDRVWISERAGQLIGSIAIVGRSEAKAQLVSHSPRFPRAGSGASPFAGSAPVL